MKNSAATPNLGALRSGTPNQVLPRGLAVREGIVGNVNLTQRLGSMRKAYEVWGICNAIAALMYCMLPTTSLGQFQVVLTFAVSISCFLQIFFGIFKLRVPVRMPIVGVVIGVFAVWASVTTLVMNGGMGRPFGTLVWGWHHLWLYHYLLFYIAMDMTHLSGTRFRPFFTNVLLIIYGLSGLTGILQLMKVPFAMSLSSSQAFGEIFRPTGLGHYSFELGFQATVGMAILGSRIINRPLKVWEWAGVGFFALTILVAQYRTCYISGIMFVGGILLLLQFRRNITHGVAVALTGTALLAFPIILFPSKFAYGLRGFNLNDQTLVARQIASEQLEPILRSRAWTGIGADPNIMLSTNFHVFDKWGSMVVDNFYRMALACFGYPGLALVILIFIGMAVGFGFRAIDTIKPVKELGLAALLMLGSLMIINLSGNGIVYPTVGYPILLLIVMGSRNSEEGHVVRDYSAIYRWFNKVLVR